MEGYTLAHGYWGSIDSGAAVFERLIRTGEDVYEISCHGGQHRCCSRQRARHRRRAAGPGEFSRRAFSMENGPHSRETVMDMIGAAEKQAQVAYRQLTGGVSRVIHERTDHLYGALARLEMLLDWDEEEERPEDRELLVHELEHSEHELRLLADSFAGGRIIREGLAVVIAGSPNVGKSSILNALSGRDRAIPQYPPRRAIRSRSISR